MTMHRVEIMLLFSFQVLALLAARTVASLNLSTAASLACGELSQSFPNNVAYAAPPLQHPNPATLNFTYTVTNYWNAALGQLIPFCVFFPAAAADVACAVQILLKYPDVPWAAKSGGHNPNADWSSVQGGVLISFRPFMQSTTLNADGTASVEPGSKWDEALSTLEPYSRALVGGRLGDIGVAGYTLGGGLSFLSSEYGMACDLVTEFEVVLADGNLVLVNESQNTDLFFALKGGGNQFAIVTKFTMKTVPIGQVWGGIRIYTFDKASAILNATHDFTANYLDNKAAIIPTFETQARTQAANGLADIFTVFLFYDGPTVPPGVFDGFDAITPLIDETKVQSYADLLIANDVGNIYGLNVLIRGQTIPCLPGDAGRDVLQHQLEDFLAITSKSEINETKPISILYTFAVQPLPRAIPAASLSSGSQNTFAFDVADGDRIWMEYSALWPNLADTAQVFADADQFTKALVEYTKTTYPNAVSTHQTNAADGYRPSFLNDAMSDQATSLFYKADVYERLKGIQKARDRHGFFSQRTGGPKFV